MKKYFGFILSCLICVLLLVPASAASWITSELTNELDSCPDWVNDATVVEFEDSFTEGATNALMGDQMGFGYVFLKDNGLGDYTVEFTVDKDGVYNIGFKLMAWSKSVPRSTNVKVDDADWVYVMYDYNDEDQYSDHYWTGLSAELTKGKHTFTLSLASDFDNTNVKSLYFDNFFYAYAGEAGSTSAAPASDAEYDTYQAYPDDRALGDELVFATGGQEWASGYDAKGGIGVDLFNFADGGSAYCPKNDTCVWYDFEVKEKTDVTFIIDYIARDGGANRGVDYAVDGANGANRVFIDLIESSEHQWVVGTFTVEAGKHSFYVYAPTGMDDTTLKSCDVYGVELYGNPAAEVPAAEASAEVVPEPASEPETVSEPAAEPETEPEVVVEPITVPVSEPAEIAEKAPQTFDAALISAAAAVLSLAGFTLTKKK
ncbi:MAG: hypothetical protein ACI4XJ_10730 [Eubacteriales bacterium]